MDNKLLVRIYNVGLGDCIYLRIPDKQNGEEIDRHVLIDCGNTYADKDVLEKAVKNLSSELGKDETNNLLDLLIVTHPHQDHIAGFDVCLGEFKKIDIGRVLLSASMNPEHEHAPKSLALQQFSGNALQQLGHLSLNPTFNTLVKDLLGLSNDGALKALRTTLPKQSKEKEPQYIHDEISLDDVFSDKENIKLIILGPANNIDGEYLGKIEDVRENFMGMASLFGMGDEPAIADNWEKPRNIPKNISKSDFRRLRERLFNNLLAFVFSNNVLINNTSVVLLLEWYGNRLLFTGDAQCKLTRDGEYEEGKPNGSWNVMWHYHEDKLSESVDFLKIGHHASHNATPWKYPKGGEEEHPINKIFDKLVPKEEKTTQVVISTERLKYPNIPHRHLLEVLGERALITRQYDERALLHTKELGGQWKKYNIDEEVVPIDVLQPLRTDLEYQHTGSTWEPWIDVEFEPK